MTEEKKTYYYYDCKNCGYIERTDLLLIMGRCRNCGEMLDIDEHPLSKEDDE